MTRIPMFAVTMVASILVVSHALQFDLEPAVQVAEQQDADQVTEANAAKDVTTSKSREAVVLMVRAIEPGCMLKRLMALALSTPRRDVWVLYDKSNPVEDLSVRHMLDISNVKYEAQPDTPLSEAWSSFGGPSSGRTKPSFLIWASNKTEYEFFWHLEDDVFYTGKWGNFFDAGASEDNEEGYALEKQLVEGASRGLESSSNELLDMYSRVLRAGTNSKADLVGQYRGNLTSAWHKLTDCKVNGQPCLGNKETHLQFMWMVSRISHRFVVAMKRALSRGDGKFAGHHEALTPNFCLVTEWCSMQQLSHQGIFVPFNSHRLKVKEDMYMANLAKIFKKEIEDERVYHPVKCEGGHNAGGHQLHYAEQSKWWEEHADKSCEH